MALFKCPKCDKDVSDTCKFCIHCGYKLKIKCPECSKEIPSNAQVCKYCGFRFQKKLPKILNPKKKEKTSVLGTIFWTLLLIGMVHSCISDKKDTHNSQSVNNQMARDTRSFMEQNLYHTGICILSFGLREESFGNTQYRACICNTLGEITSPEMYKKITKCAETGHFEICIHKEFDGFDWYEIAKNKCSTYK